MKPLANMSESERQGFFIWLTRKVTKLLRIGPTDRTRYVLVIAGDDGPPNCIGNGDRAALARLLREAADLIDAANRVSLSGILRVPPQPWPAPDPESRIGRAMKGLYPD